MDRQERPTTDTEGSWEEQAAGGDRVRLGVVELSISYRIPKMKVAPAELPQGEAGALERWSVGRCSWRRRSPAATGEAWRPRRHTGLEGRRSWNSEMTGELPTVAAHEGACRRRSWSSEMRAAEQGCRDYGEWRR